MPKPEPDRFDEMLANWKTLLPRMRDKWGRCNRPLTNLRMKSTVANVTLCSFTPRMRAFEMPTRRV